MIKKTYLIFMVILIAVSGITLAEEKLSISEKQNIYLVYKNDYQFGDGYDVKIYQLKKVDDEIRFRTVEYFNTYVELDSNYYQDYDFLTMKDASDILYMVKYNKPWETTRFSVSDVGFTFPLRKEGQTYLGIKVGNYLTLMNLDNFTKEEYKIEKGNMAYELIQEELDYLGFGVINGELKVIPSHQITYRYQPPEEIIGDADTAAVCLNNEKYNIIQLNTYDDIRLISRRILVVMDKETGGWESYDIRGKTNWTEIYPPYIIYRVGDAQAGWYRPTYTGEYIIVNYEKGRKSEFFLEPPAKIYYADEECIIAKSRERILDIPVIAGEVIVDQAEIIFEESTVSEKDTVLSVKYVDGIFLGPKELPEEIMIDKARETNAKADSLYKKELYDQAVFYYKLAIEYNPEYAQAYSNLGLAYYKLKRYDGSIEYSQKAIELTENDTIKASSYYNIAMAYEAMEEWDKALENYEKALEYKEHDIYREGIERMEEKIRE